MKRIILDFAKEFKNLRHELGETQQSLLDITGIPKQTIANWECKKYEPPTWSQVLIIKMLEDLIEQRFYNINIDSAEYYSGLVEEDIEAELYKEAIEDQELYHRELLHPY